jgi:hypothetical protein
MSYVAPRPRVHLHVGDALTVTVQNPRARVTAPRAADQRVLCRESVSAKARMRTATFVALHPGRAYIGATITGVPGGVNHPAYAVVVTIERDAGTALHGDQGRVEGAFIAVGGPAGVATSPEYGHVVFRSSTGSQRTVVAGRDGLFDVALPAGTYTVTGRSPLYDSGNADCIALGRVQVRAGQITHADVLCERS